MRIAIAGCSGHINYVLEALSVDKSLRVTAFAPAPGEDAVSLLRYLTRLGHEPRVYDAWDDMLEKEIYDIAVAAAPFIYNAAITLRALERGLPVFCEKPLALTLDKLCDIAAAVREAGSPVCSMMGLRCDPAFAAAKRAIEQGAVGEIVLTTAQKSYKLGRRPDYYRDRLTYGGTVPWVGIHAIDWLHWYSGRRFARVTATHSLAGNGNNGSMESSALMQFELRGGGLAGANIDFLRPAGADTHGDDRVRIAGTLGILEVSHDRATLLRHDAPEKQLLPIHIPGGIFAQFTKHLRGEGENPVPTEDGIYVTAASLLAREAADTGRGIDFSKYGW